ncbi:ribosome recycling factor [Candidatus Amesbacteria bacterium RIFOXYB1_FULL_44_23]|uniref:Ribosome-recycling factor n=1 Tax=Candidatus Amesbacteria bacterium RIFOXYB1_FULL_44_23 TaxID=1797263 RepID=A0A1F4ZUF8_9BACT|nr:MAG: ribosome recycling factor [Candidatus Amesbacteria bacterium RIFOXYB1_FULL_44_23]
MSMDLGDVPVKMQKIVEFVKSDVAAIRTGRATPSLVENIVIKAYGGTTSMKIIELASVTAPDSQSLLITPYDQSIIGDIRRDIVGANVGLTPVLDNNVIRIAVPALTEERRLEYVKMLHTKLEDGRVKLRQVRHDKMSELKRAGEAKEINEDEQSRMEEELQKVTDKMMEAVEEVGKAKEAELMKI